MYLSTTVRPDPAAVAEIASHARGYHHRARQFRDDDAAASLVFNVAALAVENYLVAVCKQHGVEPVSHPFTHLAADVEALVDVEPDVGGAVRALDRIFGICSLDDYRHGEPGPADAERTLWICDRLSAYLPGERGARA